MNQYYIFNDTKIPVHDVEIIEASTCEKVYKTSKLSGHVYTDNIKGKRIWYTVTGGYFGEQKFKSKKAALNEAISRQTFCSKHLNIKVEIFEAGLL